MNLRQLQAIYCSKGNWMLPSPALWQHRLEGIGLREVKIHSSSLPHYYSYIEGKENIRLMLMVMFLC